ncbi:MAG: hypothetical protein RLZZ210_1196 [Pseudomonadota bacterium]|jgi:cytochrome c oxidase assembly protein subunit 15
MLYIKLSLIVITCALLPLYLFIRKYKGASPKHKIMYFTALITFITFDLIVFGAFTRLTDSGLGCPDWPGCFAKSNPFSADYHIDIAEKLSPNGAVTSMKAWIEMIHRYIAAMVGFLIIILNILVFKYRKQLVIKPYHTLIILGLILLQGAFGAWTVTLKLQPIIVSTHLVLAIIFILSIFSLYCIQKNNYMTNTNISNSDNFSSIDTYRNLIILGIALVALQICLGAWVSSNYAMLGCTEFPTCISGKYIPQVSKIHWEQAFHMWRELGLTHHGDILSFNSLTVIHFVHRCMALIVFISLCLIYAKIYFNFIKFSDAKSQKICKLIKVSFIILLLQITTGISTVLLSIPIATGLVHSAGATLLIGSLLYIYWQLHYYNKS